MDNCPDLPAVLAGDERFAALSGIWVDRLAAVDPQDVLVRWIDHADVSLLPILAEEYSLNDDGWDMAETEQAQRNLLKNAILLHRYKGTPWAVKTALNNIGIPRVALNERPEGAHWAEFDLDITVIDRPVTEAMYPRIDRLIDSYKPARSLLRRLTISMACQASLRAAAVTFAGDIVTVQPYQLTDITAPSMQPKAGIGHQDWGTTTIYPRTP